jgi:hypothetical protein
MISWKPSGRKQSWPNRDIIPGFTRKDREKPWPMSLPKLESNISRIPIYVGSTRWRSWLRHYATSRKVVGSIPDEVTGFFNWSNPSSRTMALGSAQPLTEMSTRNILGDKPLSAHKDDNLTLICGPFVWKTYGPPRPVSGIALLFYLFPVYVAATTCSVWCSVVWYIVIDVSEEPTASTFYPNCFVINATWLHVTEQW